MTLPTITATGNLAADPELRFTQSGDAVASFRIGCGERKLNRQTQEWEDGDTTWLTVSIWRAKAEAVAEQVRKGETVTVVGRLRMKTWERDGQKRTSYEIDAESVAKVVKGAREFTPHPARPKDDPAWADATPVPF